MMNRLLFEKSVVLFLGKNSNFEKNNLIILRVNEFSGVKYSTIQLKLDCWIWNLMLTALF